VKLIRAHATYANVMASIAVFVAIGGTSYAAITLPPDSVGQKQLKSRSVGSTEIKNRTIRLQDLARKTRDSLTGPRGPAGPVGPAGAAAVELRASINSAGGFVAGNATSSDSPGVGKHVIGFSRGLAGCTPIASLARNPGGLVVDPGPGFVTVGIEGDAVAVHTYRADGTPSYLPFNVIVAC
jgi:hypothetical protein